MATVVTTDTPGLGADIAGMSYVDWRAVLAGAAASAAIFALLMGFGSALGLSLTSARPYAGYSATGVALVTAIWFAAVNIGSFAAGGYLAGRMRARYGGTDAERQFRDGAHGFLVWAVGTLVAAYILAMAATGLVRGAADLASSAAGGVAQGAAQGVAARASVPGAPSIVPDPLGYSVDLMLRRPAPAAGAPAPAAAPPAEAGSAAALNAEIGRVFVMTGDAATLNAADKQYLAGLVAARTGLAQPEAEKRVDESFARYKALRAEAETRVRDAAEKARKSAVIAGFLAAAVSLAALIAAIWAAGWGGMHREENTSVRLFGVERLW